MKMREPYDRYKLEALKVTGVKKGLRERLRNKRVGKVSKILGWEKHNFCLDPFSWVVGDLAGRVVLLVGIHAHAKTNTDNKDIINNMTRTLYVLYQKLQVSRRPNIDLLSKEIKN